MDATLFINSIMEPIAPYVDIFAHLVKTWWWLPAPFLLLKPFLFIFLWWRNELFLKGLRMIMLEISLPKDVQKPIRAMETAMTGIHASVYHPPGNPWEIWIDGQLQLSVNFEIASFGGETHFYIRTEAQYREAIEASLYSQYPEVEITEVEDYVKKVPQNIPNKDWDMFGADYRVMKDDHFPIRTYKQFETEHEKDEKMIVDPVATLLEGMAKVKPGEQFWIQITAEPMGEGGADKWYKEGEALRDQLASREQKVSPSPKPILQEAAEILITGEPSAEVEEKEKQIMPVEMRLTPGEREVIGAVEMKMSKPLFKCSIRFIYLGKRDVFFKPNFRLAFAFFQSFVTLNLNAMFVFGAGKTLTKINKSLFVPLNWVRPRRLYLRCRKMFRNYVNRFPPFWPFMDQVATNRGVFVLNVEELASIFHFPSEVVAPAPGVARVAKRGAGPAELPTEE